jgi:hypothetical protein
MRWVVQTAVLLLTAGQVLLASDPASPWCSTRVTKPEFSNLFSPGYLAGLASQSREILKTVNARMNGLDTTVDVSCSEAIKALELHEALHLALGGISDAFVVASGGIASTRFPPNRMPLAATGGQTTYSWYKPTLRRVVKTNRVILASPDGSLYVTSNRSLYLTSIGELGRVKSRTTSSTLRGFSKDWGDWLTSIEYPTEQSARITFSYVNPYLIPAVPPFTINVGFNTRPPEKEKQVTLDPFGLNGPNLRPPARVQADNPISAPRRAGAGPAGNEICTNVTHAVSPSVSGPQFSSSEVPSFVPLRI